LILTLSNNAQIEENFIYKIDTQAIYYSKTDLIHKLSAKSLIQELEFEEIFQLNTNQKEVTDLAIRYNLTSKYTSFVAIEEEQRFEQNKEDTKIILEEEGEGKRSERKVKTKRSKKSEPVRYEGVESVRLTSEADSLEMEEYASDKFEFKATTSGEYFSLRSIYLLSLVLIITLLF
jgi:hypothetical protein